MTASKRGHASVVEALLKHGALMELQDVVSMISHMVRYLHVYEKWL